MVGLTGGIGSGKSAAAEYFAQLGAAVVDTDVISHALTGPGGAAIPAIRQAFGDHMITSQGALDRAAMREQVFADTASRARLEAILHPMIRLEALRQCAAANAPYVVLTVPLLVETGAYRDKVNRIAVVDCPEDVQIARVCQRSGLTELQVRAIMDAQAPRAARLSAADDVIDNCGDLAHLHQIVAALHQKYFELAQTP